MKNIKKALFIIGLQFIFANCYAQTVDINALHYVTSTNQVQLQFDVTARANYHLFMLTNPFRLVIDIKNSQLATPALTQPPGDHPLFANIRYATRNSGMRIVFDFKNHLDVKKFSVNAQSDDEHRLVINLLALGFVVPTPPSNPPVLPSVLTPPNNEQKNPNEQLKVNPPPANQAVIQKTVETSAVISPSSTANDAGNAKSEPTVTDDSHDNTQKPNSPPVADEDSDEEAEEDAKTPVKEVPKPVEKSAPSNDNIVEGKALLEIIINGENLGAQLVNLKKDDVLVSTTAFKDWRIKKDLWAGQTDNVSLRTLAPNLQYTVDNNNAALNITLTPESFEPQVLETQSQYNTVIPADAVHPAPWSAFANYAINANFSQPKGFDSLNLPWEIGINVGQWFAFGNFNSNYLNQDQSFKTTRSSTFLQWEDMESRQKVTLGDFSVNTPTLSSSGNFGGLLWQSNFRQYGQFQSMPSLGLDFNVATPSHAELYVNDVKTKEWDLQPGMVSLPSVLTSGQGNATLVLTDAFGKQQQISQPFYITQQLLKEGLHEFYYGLGAKHHFSNKMIDYSEGVLFGAHRYGFTNSFTGGAAFTVHKKVSTVGLSATQSFLGNSLIDTALAASHQDGGLNGYLGVASYQLNFQPINLSLNAGYMSQQFGNLNIDAASLQKNKYRLQASINFNVPYTGSSIGASVSQSTSWSNNSHISKSLTLFFRQSLFSSLNLNLQANHDLATGDNVVSAMLNYFPHVQGAEDLLSNHNYSYQANYSDKTHVDTQTWQVQKQGNIGEGYNYTAALQKQDQNFSGIARYQYQDNNGIYTANYAQNEQTIRGNASIAGSLITANNEVHFGRPITDSFAIVKVNGSEEDVPVYSNGARLGWGNADTTVVIPNLPSRQVGKMSIKPEDIGLAVEADRPEQSIAVGVRTGSVVEFNLSQFVAAEGQAYTLDKDGNKQYLEALPLEYTAKGKAQDSFIAKKGFFYLENVPTGEFKATVKRYKADCILHLTIPKSDKVVVKLGDVLCE